MATDSIPQDGKPRAKVSRIEDAKATYEPAQLPESPEVEAALLDCLLLNTQATLTSCADVYPRHFFTPYISHSWGVAQAIEAEGDMPDLPLMVERLTAQGRLESASELRLHSIGSPHYENPRAYAKVIKRIALQRFAISSAGDLAAVAYRKPDELEPYWQTMQESMGDEFAEAKAARFRLKSIAEIRNRERPLWLVRGILQERKLWLFYGESNAGKSFLALDLALSLATGTPWLGREVPCGHVVYVAAEGIDGIRDRLDAWLAVHGLEDAPNFHIIDESPDLLETGDVAGVIAQVNTLEESPIAVIFDTLAASMPGADENSAESMGAAIERGIKRVQRECECAVLTVHHAGKDATKGARGWSGLRGAMDTQIEVIKDEDTGIVTVKCRKARDASYFPDFHLTLKPIVIDRDNDVTSCVIESTDALPTPTKQRTKITAADKLRNLMQTLPNGATHGELKRQFMDKYQMSSRSFENALAELNRLREVVAVMGRYLLKSQFKAAND